MEKPKEDLEAQLKSEVIRLTNRVAELEAQLKAAKEKEGSALGFAKEIMAVSMATHKDNEVLSARNKELENPDGRYNRGLSWLAKVVHVLGRVGRPMRAAELRQEIDRMDGGFRAVTNPETFLSVILTKGVQKGRLRLFKVAGTRGGYYALQHWTNETGQLNAEMQALLL